MLRRWCGKRLKRTHRLTAFSGSLVLAYMALPTIISVAEDALDSVPRAYRDAALALGADALANHLARNRPGGAHRHPHRHDCWALAGPLAKRWP